MSRDQNLKFHTDDARGKLPLDLAPVTAMRFWDAQHGRVVYIQSGQLWTATTDDGGATWKQRAMPDVKRIYNLFLTRDGQTLSAIDVTKKEILILQYQQPQSRAAAPREEFRDRLGHLSG